MTSLHTMTHHAEVRSQQRGIAPVLVDLALQLGASAPTSDGAEKRYFDRSARKRLRSYMGASLYRTIEPHLDIYVVEKDGRAITVGHFIKPIRSR